MSRPAKASRARRARPPWPWIIGAGVVGAFVLLVAALARQPRTVRVGDHWHARLTIALCDRTLPPLPPGPGDVHTHGDGVIHVHPASTISAGRRANLGLFFRSTPVRISATRIAVGGEVYANGQRCPDGKTGTLRVLVRPRAAGDFRLVRDFPRYLPQDGDEIRVLFGP